MASVALKFTPPDMENLVTLKIFESPTKEGIYNEIETVTAIGSYPDYIDNYTTANATDLSYWFCIQWVDNKGAASNRSDSIQGNTTTVVATIVSRVMMRDSSIDERVAVQEAEAVVASVYGGDPYDPTITPTYEELRGMTNLVLAMCYLTESAQVTTSEYVAGVVSQKTSDTAMKNRQAAIDKLIAAANHDLNLSYSVIMALKDIAVAGLPVITSLDQSRLLVEIR